VRERGGGVEVEKRVFERQREKQSMAATD